MVGRTGGVAEDLVAAAGVRLETIPVSGLDLSSPVSALGFAGRMPVAVTRALRLIRRFRPHVVVGAAGYVSVPVVVAARTARIPVVLLEQNAHPGRATRILARAATAVATSFEETAGLLPGVRAVWTGNPVRQTVLKTKPAPLGERCRHVLVMGGSQGAHTLNTAVADSVAGLLEADPELTITHQTGSLDIDAMTRLRDGLPEAIRDRYTVEAFLDPVAPAVAAADLVVMRAGGSSLAEVSVLGRPMILVPYPHAGGHQRFNALPYVDAGAAVLVEDADFDGPRLAAEVRALIDHPRRWLAMAAACVAEGRPAAGAEVATLVAGVARERWSKS